VNSPKHESKASLETQHSGTTLADWRSCLFVPKVAGNCNELRTALSCPPQLLFETHGRKDKTGVGSQCTLAILLANSLKTGETRAPCHIVTNGKYSATLSHRTSNIVPHWHIGR